ncbi:MAG: FAD-binding protein [Fimbriimonadaceae bacterium]|nr:FAD-binding protein [Fimbriimonadaceae bacterium]
MNQAEMTAELGRILSPERVLSGPAHDRAYDCDAYTVDRSRPQVVVLPESTAEAAAVVAWCHRHAVPFTPRGAGTGLSGGSLAALGGVVISTKRMTKILSVDVENRRLRAQAGAVNLRLSQAVAAHGLHFAPDPSSQSVSTLGGNIAENSGGPHTLKYGVTVQHVSGLTLVGFDGRVIELQEGPGLDLLSLVVGSEGTLGLVTEAEVRLTPNPEHVVTLLASFAQVRSATETVAAIIQAGVIPAALEMMDHGIMEAVRAAFGLRFPAEARALLLIECDGSPDRVGPEVETVARICRDHACLELAEAADSAERARLWTARKKGVGALGRIAPTLVTHDGVIPRSKLPDMLDAVDRIGAEFGLKVANIFHAGDGNLHPIFCFDDREPGVVDRVVAAGEKIMRLCIEWGGSVTGEHGIGVEKLDLISLMFDEDDLALQRRAQSIFHNDSGVNPCKIIPNQKGCVEHMKRWRGVAT